MAEAQGVAGMQLCEIGFLCRCGEQKSIARDRWDRWDRRAGMHTCGNASHATDCEGAVWRLLCTYVIHRLPRPGRQGVLKQGSASV